MQHNDLIDWMYQRGLHVGLVLMATIGLLTAGVVLLVYLTIGLMMTRNTIKEYAREGKKVKDDKNV